MNESIISVRNLKKYYPVKGGFLQRRVADVHAVDDVSFNIKRGECLGLVGESGCGKTTLGKTILRLHDADSGSIRFNTEEGGTDIASVSSAGMKKLRRRMQIVFQDPSNSLDPRMLVKDIVAEPVKAQKLLKQSQLEDHVVEILGKVGMAREHLRRYPHEFSGGQRQRIAVARALSTNPDFILMDEPTSALDVSVQAQILNLLMQLKDELKLTYLFVTHHLLVVKYLSDRIIVMYLGKIVEVSPSKELFSAPRHPYTKALLSAISVPDPERQRKKIILSGDVPDPISPPSGCRFHPRCPHAEEICSREEPKMESVSAEHSVACHRHRDLV